MRHVLPRRQRDMWVYMWTIRVGACVMVKLRTPPSPDQLAEVHLGFSRVSLSQFLPKLSPLLVLLAELHCVPGGDHVGQGGFQSGEGLYQRPRGGRRSRKNKTSGDETTSKYTQGTRSMSCRKWKKALTLNNLMDWRLETTPLLSLSVLNKDLNRNVPKLRSLNGIKSRYSLCLWVKFKAVKLDHNKGFFL